MCLRCATGQRTHAVASAVHRPKVDAPRQDRPGRRPNPYNRKDRKQGKANEDDELDPMDPASYAGVWIRLSSCIQELACKGLRFVLNFYPVDLVM